ncbi:conjugal transfer protein TrbD [Burkholderia sp. LMG 13014]|uniref:conjugal transfer protein TrbD n=1 Tax=Burkholderia sp. LMG 13014 TaxID=2709306 RepID=UPI001962FAFF|nr:conjugal transfer protein TrbD [Burkholderia sp. LMG 13014]
MDEDDILPLRRVHKSVERRITLGGGERELVMSSFLVGSTEILAVSGSFGPWYGIPFGLGLIIGLVYVCRRMGEADPHMSKVMLRSLKYQRYYPAHAHVGAEIPDVKTFR